MLLNKKQKELLIDQVRNNLLLFFFVAIVIVMSILAPWAAGTSRRVGLGFAIYEICVIFVPGYVVSAIAFKQITRLERLLFSYIIGYGINTVVFACIMMIGIDEYIRTVNLLVFIIFIAIGLLLKKNHKYFYQEPGNLDEIALLVVVMISLFVVKLICFSMNMLPPIYGDAYFDSDYLHWVSDVASACMSFPVGNIRAMGAEYNYHYLAFVQQAAIAKTLDISAIYVTAIYSYIQSTILLSLSFICFAKRMINDKLLVLIAVLISLFSTGIENQSIVTYRYHIILQPMAFDIGLALFISYLLLWKLIYDEKRTTTKVVIANFFMIVLLTGIKAPCAVIGIVFAGIICASFLFRRMIRSAIIYGGTTLAGFGIMYFAFMSKAAGNYDTSLSTKGVETSYTVRETIITLVRFLRYIIEIQPICFVIIVTLGIVLFIRKKLSMWNTFLMVIVVIGSALGFFVDMVGKSQMYFTMTIIPVASFLSIKFLDELQGQNGNTIICHYLVMLMLFFTIGVYIQTDYGDWTTQFADKGIRVLLNKEERGKADNVALPICITKDEYEAYEWIRNNTDKDALFIVDDVYYGQSISLFPAIAERRTYWTNDNEEIEEIKDAFDGDKKALSLQVQKTRYFVFHNNTSDGSVFNELKRELSYSNDSISVIEIDNYIGQ